MLSFLGWKVVFLFKCYTIFVKHELVDYTQTSSSSWATGITLHPDVHASVLLLFAVLTVFILIVEQHILRIHKGLLERALKTKRKWLYVCFPITGRQKVNEIKDLNWMRFSVWLSIRKYSLPTSTASSYFAENLFFLEIKIFEKKYVVELPVSPFCVILPKTLLNLLKFSLSSSWQSLEFWPATMKRHLIKKFRNLSFRKSEKLQFRKIISIEDSWTGNTELSTCKFLFIF